MCRYAMYGPYKDVYACFTCRKVFKQTSNQELEKKEIQNRQYKCPQCGEIMKDMGHDFQAPKQKDRKQWLKVELLYNNGFTYHSCGCGGPGYRPAKLSEVEEFLRSNKMPASEGERLLSVLTKRA
jgi:DNA-directed RNA polymerase subunit RPC12/RpoP